jgi:hypothetical protein
VKPSAHGGQRTVNIGEILRNAVGGD